MPVIETRKTREEHMKQTNVKVAMLALREQELKENIARLKTEEGINNEIREKFSVTQEGEYVAVIIDDKKTSSSTDSALPWYKRFWFAIIGDK